MPAWRLASVLEAQGWSVFWDRTIPAGKSWRAVIGAALADARCVVVLWSQHSVTSHWVMEEADYGLRRRALIPALIEGVELPLGFSSIQAADLCTWAGNGEDTAIQQFFGDVASILGPPPIVPAEEHAKAEAEALHKAKEQQRQQAAAAAQRGIEESVARPGLEQARADFASQRGAEPVAPRGPQEEQKLAKSEARRRRKAGQKRRGPAQVMARRTPEKLKLQPAPVSGRKVEQKQEDATPDTSPSTTVRVRFWPKEAVSAIWSRVVAAAVALQWMLSSVQLQPRLVHAAVGGGVIAVVAAGTWFVLTGLGGQPWRDCDVCPWMISLPGGTFTMGSPEGEEGRSSDEGPQREVTVQPFAIGRYEVTFAEWDACVEDGGCTHKPDDKGWGRGNRPVINISWHDAQEYVDWLKDYTGQPYRLPSEAELEYAVRAVTTTSFALPAPTGSNDIRDKGLANCGDCSSEWDGRQTAPVGSFAANGFGLHDTAGNVWEWCEDCWNDSYRGAPDDGSAWLQGNYDGRVARGGSWVDIPGALRSANRNWSFAVSRNNLTGFGSPGRLPLRSLPLYNCCLGRSPVAFSGLISLTIVLGFGPRTHEA